MRIDRTRMLRLIGMPLLALVVCAGAAQARWSAEALANLSESERRVLSAWEAAQKAFAAQQDSYWAAIADKRAERQRKRRTGGKLTAAHYVAEQPPAYGGPPAPSAILRKLPQPPARPRRELPVVADFLRQAEALYSFRPRRVPEDEFMRAYAREALRLGLTGDQIVRVYAFETGGMGTHDMQSGFGFGVKNKRAISSALGYAQLLGANSIGELAENGSDYAARLSALAAVSQGPRGAELNAKAAPLRAMIKTAKSLPRAWNTHVRFAMSAKGQAIHAINLDGDIGPWIQVRKLLGIKQAAERAGFDRLTGAQMELLNLAGPGRGLEMLHPSARDAATANFFERTAYSRNPVVHGKTAATLLTAIDGIMEKNLQRDGSKRFLAAFRAERPASAAADR